MTTSERADAPATQPSGIRDWRIAPRLGVIVVPIVVVTVLLGLFLIWELVSSGDSGGFSGSDFLATAIGAVVLTVVAGTLIAYVRVGRSISAGIEEITRATDKVAHKDLIDLLDTLRSPDPDLTSIAPLDLDLSRFDEVGDLARSFDDLHRSLIAVASRQMEALRSGVSSIFVTLARRNSSLVDRQLATLDELEAREEDPRILGGYYQLDHLATRMRRNAESLLVLAGSEAPRVWAKATDMADVVRAAVGEVDEYQRIDVFALEPARLSGGAVSDMAHLLAELLENALQCSPPSEMVRVTGLFDMTGYQLTVSDRGVGVSDARLAELNRILDKPPELGLSVEPTLGMYVVAKLAHRHGVNVELIKGVPGLTVRVTVPRDHLEVDDGSSREDRPLAHPEPVFAGSPDADGLSDTATREYVLTRIGRDRAEGGEPAHDPEEDVIDLTTPEMTQEWGNLPIRRPGTAFSEDDETPSIGPGEGAIGIKSALAAYERGRRAAESHEDAGGRP